MEHYKNEPEWKLPPSIQMMNDHFRANMPGARFDAFLKEYCKRDSNASYACNDLFGAWETVMPLHNQADDDNIIVDAKEEADNKHKRMSKLRDRLQHKGFTVVPKANAKIINSTWFPEWLFPQGPPPQGDRYRRNQYIVKGLRLQNDQERQDYVKSQDTQNGDEEEEDDRGTSALPFAPSARGPEEVQPHMAQTISL